MDHGNEFRGSKNGGKELWGGLKWPENQENTGDSRCSRRRVRRPDPDASGGNWP